MDMLFFSRGRGRGHAIPDMAIMQEIIKNEINFNWNFVSYATGADTFRSLGYTVHDLELPEENQFLATLSRIYGILNDCKPKLIVAHEEFSALVAAKLLKIPSIFITDWYMNETSIYMQPLEYAEQIIFLENQGVFDEPSYVKGKVQYVGPFVRDMAYSSSDRIRARSEMGLNDDATVIACLPGGWATESRAPIAELLVAAFEKICSKYKKMFWVAGKDVENLRQITSTNNDIILTDQIWPIEKLMVACDLVITKGNRGTILEASHLAIPSISLSHGLNPVEDYIVPRFASNLPLRVKGMNPEFLASCIEKHALGRNKISFESRATSNPKIVASVLTNQMKNLGFFGNK